MPSYPTPIKAARPIDTATGTETAKKISIDRIINCDMTLPLPQFSFSCAGSDYRVIDRWRLRCIQPACNHAQDSQCHSDGNSDIDPGDRKLEAGECLKAHAPSHLGAHPAHEAKKRHAHHHNAVL